MADKQPEKHSRKRVFLLILLDWITGLTYELKIAYLLVVSHTSFSAPWALYRGSSFHS